MRTSVKKASKFKLTFYFIIFAIAATLTTNFLISHRTKRKSTYTAPPLDVNLFTANLEPAQYQPTDTKNFGESGVNLFSNLIFTSNTFYLSERTSDSDLNFFGSGKYNYRIKHLSPQEFEQKKSNLKSAKLPGTTLILTCSDEMKHLQRHYFHFYEELVLAFSAHKSFNTDEVKSVIFMDNDNWEGVNQTNLQILQAVFPNAHFLNKTAFHALSTDRIIQFENAILVDRHACHKNEEVCKYNKMVMGHVNLIKADYLKELRNTVLTHLKTYDKPNRKPTITYINRKSRRYLDHDFEKFFLQTLATEFPDYQVQPVWFEKLSYPEQLQTIRNTDILIGAHGNGLTHSYFLPDHALVIEIFPEGAFAMDYQMINELSGHDYYAVEPKLGIISKTGNHMPPRGNVNQVIPEFDMKWVLEPIKAHVSGKKISDLEQPLIKD